MLVFDPQNPFPLLPPLQPEQYAEAKRHAAAVDAWLGIEIERVEKSILPSVDGEQTWSDRHSSIFLTPYVELRTWLEFLALPPNARVVDLGAGYGRLGFVMARHAPGCFFEGFEIVPERVAAGQKALEKFCARNAKLTVANIARLEWKPPRADVYFIYDYGTRAAIGKTLEDLKGISKAQGIRVVGRGRGVRDQIEREHPWLSSVHSPVHFAHYSVYRSFV